VDPVTCLWVLDLDTGEERVVCDPRDLEDVDTSVPAEERARRERSREMAEGVVAYGADRDARVAAFALGGRLFVADLVSGGAREVPTSGGVIDPRVDPTGQQVAFVSNGALRLVYLDVWDRPIAAEEDPSLLVAAEDGPDVKWGLAEFVAAEEMDRLQGFWWSPDGRAIVAARVDEGPVQRTRTR
jgi:dipeptidyl-peptidase-4